MSGVGQLTSESVKGLGPGAHLVTVLPSAVLVLSGFALVSSRLYPWSGSAAAGVAAGPESVLHATRGLGAAGAALLALSVLVTAVLLRPFQISMVQLLEGYWPLRGRGMVDALAKERHVRRRSRFALRRDPLVFGPSHTDFGVVAAYARRLHRAGRMRARSRRMTGTYLPERREDLAEPTLVMPTLLGNLLRRAELSAGDRYGLETVVTYPRLYPHLSEPLDREISSHLNGIDTAGAFTVVFIAELVLTLPLVWRLDGWSLVPVVLAALAVVPYRGALVVAERYGHLLATAYDLHRFDMLTAMHLRLPRTPDEERRRNGALTQFWSGEVDRLPNSLPYEHRQQTGPGGISRVRPG